MFYCRLCKSPLKETFVDLGLSPLANNYVKADQLSQPEPKYPLHVFVCSDCLLVQLPRTVDPAQIFSDYAYFSSFSDSWLQHAKHYAEAMIPRWGLDSRSQVVEIASNDGYLLQYFKEKKIPVLGIEPAANIAKVAEQKGIATRVLFFGEETSRVLAAEGRQADLLIGNNVFAHVPDLRSFTQGMKNLLKPKGVITLEFPHLLQLVAQNQFDTIYHEHFSYLSLLVVEKIFAQHGLVVFDVETLPTHGGSLRLFGKHKEDRSKNETPRVQRLREEETRAGMDRLDYYLAFHHKVIREKEALLRFLTGAIKEKKKVVGYGAPAKGNTLLNYCGIGPELLSYTVDRSPHKQGLFLPGSHIPIASPDKIKQTKPDYVLILPWNLRDEIAQQMAFIREWGGRFVVPIPQLEVF